jgi:hypothetical protein
VLSFRTDAAFQAQPPIFDFIGKSKDYRQNDKLSVLPIPANASSWKRRLADARPLADYLHCSPLLLNFEPVSDSSKHYFH